jgi:hypothetical protein
VPVSTYRKAIVSAVLAFLAPLLALFASSADLDWRGIVGSLIAGAVAGVSTYAVPNAATVNGSVPGTTV